jgi:hypothetical protein
VTRPTPRLLLLRLPSRHLKRNDCTQQAIRIDEVEALIEDHYKTVQPRQQTLDDLKALILEEVVTQRDHAAAERGQQERRLRGLQEERHKLLQAHYAGAIPLDLLKTEQDRITRETTAAEQRLTTVETTYQTVTTNLDRATGLAADWHSAYTRAGATIRRQLNQAIFTKLWIDDRYNITSEFTEPFRTMLSPEVVAPATIRAAERTGGATEDEIDALWQDLSAQWATEHVNATTTRDNEPRGSEQARGSKENHFVGQTGQLSNPCPPLARMLNGPKSLVRNTVPAPAERSPRQRQVHLSRQEQEELIQRHHAGALQRELADAYGVHRTTVRAIVGRHRSEALTQSVTSPDPNVPSR